MEKWLLKNIFNNKLRDSKKLSPKKREEIYKELKKLHHIKKAKGNPCHFCFFAVAHISNKIIDKKGITYATRLGVEKCLKNIKLKHLKEILKIQLN
jgi:ribonuclease HII